MELNGAPISRSDIAALGLVGYGHFTSMRVEQGAVRGLTQHMDRLVRDCRTVFDAELDVDRVRAFVRHALIDVGSAVVVRVTIFAPVITLGKPGAEADPAVLVTLREATSVPETPLTLRSAVYSRDLPRTKHVGLFGALHQRRLAQRDGFDDVLFTTAEGFIGEIATSNIGVIADGHLVWPDAEVLPGVTMGLLSGTLAEKAIVKPITLAELSYVDGAVATNAAVGVRAIGRVDDIELPIDHATVERLRAAYESVPVQQV